jgi:hypothetical protein
MPACVAGEFRQGHDAGIVHQNVERNVFGKEARSEGIDRRRSSRSSGQISAAMPLARPAHVSRPGGDNDAGSGCEENAHSLAAKPGITTRDDGGATGKINRR